MSKNIYAILVQHDSDNETPVFEPKPQVVHHHQDDFEEETDTPVLSFRNQLLQDRLRQKLAASQRQETADSENADNPNDGGDDDYVEDNQHSAPQEDSLQVVDWRAGSHKAEPESTEIITLDEYIAKSGLNFSYLTPEPPLPAASTTRQNKKTTEHSTLLKSKITEKPVFVQKPKNLDDLVRRTSNIMEARIEKPRYQKRRRSPLRESFIEDNEENFPALG